MDSRVIIEMIAAAGSTFAFGIIFNLKGQKLIYASVGGAIGWAIYILFRSSGNSDPVSFFYSSVGITIYSEIIARILKTPVTSTLIASLIPLVPGSGVYFTMSYAVEHRVEEAIQKGIETLMITVAITMGIIVVSTFAQIYYKFKRYKIMKNRIKNRRRGR